MAYYDSYSELGDKITPFGKFLVQTRIKSMFKAVEKQFEIEGKEVLEIGPGKGYISSYLKDKGANMTLVEPGEQLREALVKKGFKSVEDYFVPPIVAKENSFDLIIMDNMFEHLHTHEKAVETLKESYRVLKPTGLLLIHSPEILSWGSHFWNGDYTHNYPTSRRRLEQMFDDYGFEIVSSRTYTGPWHGSFAHFVGFIARAQFWIDWLPVRKWRDQLNKLRSSFMVNIFFLGRPKKD